MKYLIIVFFIIVIAILAFLPVRLYASYGDGKELYVKIAWFKINLNKEKSEKKENTEKKEEKKHPKKKLSYYRSLIKTVKTDVYDILEYMRKYAVRADDFKLYIKFGWHDRAEVGIAYGMANAFVYTVMGVLHNILTVKDWNIEIIPEYEKEIFDLKVHGILKTRLVHIMVIVIKAVKILIKVKRSGGKKHGTSN